MPSTGTPPSLVERLQAGAKQEWALAKGYGKTWLSIPTWGMFARNVRAGLTKGKPFQGALREWASSAPPPGDAGNSGSSS